MSTEPARLNRSFLFVPGDSERKLDKARGNAADALILDLEDAVADARQDLARAMVREYLQAHADRSRQELRSLHSEHMRRLRAGRNQIPGMVST